MTLRALAAASVLLVSPCVAADFPSAEISNGQVTAKLLLPDAEKGYYRGTRFDWSGVIQSLKTKDHEYFGQWFEKYDPKLHDAIMGPVEEFMTDEKGLGYDEAQAGGEFIRIGVGAVRKPEERRYERFKTYDIVDGGKRSIRNGKDWIEYTQDLGNHNGYAYQYTKRISLPKGTSQMLIEHRLKNKGTKAITTSQYNHNFFMLDGQPTGPDASAQFAFDLKPLRPLQPDLAQAQGRSITYSKELAKGQSVYSEFEGFGNTASDYDIRVENKKSGAGVRIQGDQPITKLVYWSIRTTLCPEAYVTLQIPPGGEKKWSYRYTFYDTRKQ
jgi:hypothetical protein